MIHIVPEGEKFLAAGQIRRVWSLVYIDGLPHASYHAEWPVNPKDAVQVNIDVVLGKWGEDTTPHDRTLLCVIYRNHPKPGFMVTEPVDRQARYKDLAKHALSRQEVLGHPEVRDKLFALIDEIYKQDARINWGRVVK